MGGNGRTYVFKKPNKKEKYQKGLLREIIVQRKFWTLVSKMANLLTFLIKI
jgi:hypothetical protein